VAGIRLAIGIDIRWSIGWRCVIGVPIGGVPPGIGECSIVGRTRACVGRRLFLGEAYKTRFVDAAGIRVAIAASAPRWINWHGSVTEACFRRALHRVAASRNEKTSGQTDLNEALGASACEALWCCKTRTVKQKSVAWRRFSGSCADALCALGTYLSRCANLARLKSWQPNRSAARYQSPLQSVDRWSGCLWCETLEALAGLST